MNRCSDIIYTSLRLSSAAFPLITFLLKLEQQMDQIKTQMLFSGSLLGLCWILFLFLKDMTSHTVHLKQTGFCFRQTLHTMMRYIKLLANSSLVITLLIQKHIFMFSFINKKQIKSFRDKWLNKQKHCFAADNLKNTR